MIQEWNKFKGWSVLEYFLMFPNTKIHINGLSRELKISLRTAQIFCINYNLDGILNKDNVGNLHQFSLNEKDPRVQTLKRFIGPYLLADKTYLKSFLEKNKNLLSVSIYGSFASGEYGDKSDLDVLVITADERKPDAADLAKLELKLGREIGITSIPMARWRQMERKKDHFFVNIKNNHVLVWGNLI
jgi:hypothetical protein